MKNKIEKYFNIWTALDTLVLLLAIYYMAIYPWMNHWGITTTEASMALPGDGTEPGTIVVSTRGVSIHAPANQVWQWLVQIGADQAGFYSNDWLENLFLADIHNVDLIQPSWQSHQIGEPIPGASGVIYQRNFTWPTQAYEKGRMLYLWGPIVVLPVDDQTSILITRTIARPETFINEITYGWMHFVMERGMLFGIKARAEGNLNASIPLEIISNIGWTWVPNSHNKAPPCPKSSRPTGFKKMPPANSFGLAMVKTCVS